MVYTKDRVYRIIDEFLLKIRSRHSLKQVFLFGSHAKGTATALSDIDLALVFEHLDQSGVFDEAFEVFHEAQKLNASLEPLCFSKKEFEDEQTPIVREIKRTGIEILKDLQNQLDK